MYIKREIESTIDAMLKQGKVVLVTGARQVGKTTVLKQHLGNSFDYVSMENPAITYSPSRMRFSSSTRTAFPWLSTRFSACQSCFPR